MKPCCPRSSFLTKKASFRESLELWRYVYIYFREMSSKRNFFLRPAMPPRQPVRDIGLAAHSLDALSGRRASLVTFFVNSRPARRYVGIRIDTTESPTDHYENIWLEQPKANPQMQGYRKQHIFLYAHCWRQCLRDKFGYLTDWFMNTRTGNRKADRHLDTM